MNERPVIESWMKWDVLPQLSASNQHSFLKKKHRKWVWKWNNRSRLFFCCLVRRREEVLSWKCLRDTPDTHTIHDRRYVQKLSTLILEIMYFYQCFIAWHPTYTYVHCVYIEWKTEARQDKFLWKTFSFVCVCLFELFFDWCRRKKEQDQAIFFVWFPRCTPSFTSSHFLVIRAPLLLLKRREKSSFERISQKITRKTYWKIHFNSIKRHF